LIKIRLISGLAKFFSADSRRQVQLRRIRLIFGGLGSMLLSTYTGWSKK